MEDRAVVAAALSDLHEIRNVGGRQIRPQIDDERTGRRVNHCLFIRQLGGDGSLLGLDELPGRHDQEGQERHGPMVRCRVMKRTASVLALTLAVVALPRAQSEKVDLAAIGRIKDEGLNRSQVMDHIGWLSDVYGPRLTGGPAIMQASDWTIKKLTEWGLSTAHRESWGFGKGWSLVRFGAHLVEPQVQPLIGFPGSWTPGTNGTVIADVVRAQIGGEADFERYRGKLAGKIVLTQPARTVAMLDGPVVLRMTDEDFREAATVPPPAARGRGRGGATAAALRTRLRSSSTRARVWSRCWIAGATGS